MMGEMAKVAPTEDGLRQLRKDVRVPAVMPVRFLSLTSREFDSEKGLLESRASSFTTYYRWLTQQPTLSAGKEKDEVATKLVHMLFDLQGRVNRILKIVERQEEGGPSYAAAQTVDVSAGGLQLATTQKIKMGDRLKVLLDVPLAHGIEVPALTEVRSTKTLDAQENPQTAAGLQFLFIVEEDRDLLVRYIFQRQRDSLRRRRLGDQE